MEKIENLKDEHLSEMVNFDEDDFLDISNSTNYMTGIFQDIENMNSPNKVLDIGCGNGHFTKYFLNNTEKQVDGIDGFIPALKQCKKAGFTNCYYTPDINTEDISLISDRYDLIICKDFLEHLLFPEKLISQMRKLLNKDGKILIHVPNHFPLFYRLKFLFEINLDTQNFFPNHNEWDNPHIRFYTFNGLKKLFKTLGLSIVKDYSYSFFFFAPFLTSFFKRTGMGKILYKISPASFATGYTFLLKKDNAEINR